MPRGVYPRKSTARKAPDRHVPVKNGTIIAANDVSEVAEMLAALALLQRLHLMTGEQVITIMAQYVELRLRDV